MAPLTGIDDHRRPMTLHIATPLWRSSALGAALGATVDLKMEALQPVGSFKIRGIGRCCEALAARGVRRFVSSSGGNAGYAVAYAGRALGVPVTVVVPRTTTALMRARLRDAGAAVVESGASWDDAHEEAQRLAEDGDAALLHPFEGEELWAGHATLIEECAEVLASPAAVVVAVGGGGLLVGVLEGMQRAGWTDTAVVAVETEGADALAQSVQRRHLVTLPRITSLATSLGARTVSARALELALGRDVRCTVVSDRAAVRACTRFATDHRVLVEPACGAALALCYDRAPELASAAHVLVVACGGAGVSPELLAAWRAQTGDE